MTISKMKFLSFACLIFSINLINLASARLAPNQKFSLDSAAISDAIRDRSAGSPSNKLVPTGSLQGGANNDHFGWSVSLSYNGDALVVGSPFHKYIGLVQLFEQQNASQWNDAWNLTGDNEFDWFGYSTSLSGDAKRLVVGTSVYDGYAKLVETETGKAITVVGDESDIFFGHSVSVSQDGNRFAIAGYGYVRVFQIREDGSFDEIGEDILADGSSVVTLSASGDILAIGDFSYDDWKGRVRIFEWKVSEWKQLGEDMVGENDEDSFGFSLDLTADGHRLMIGTFEGNYATVYDFNGIHWEIVGGKFSGESNDDDSFGRSVSISDNGNRITIGSPNFTSDKLKARGRAVVYQFENGAWNQIDHDILGENSDMNAGFCVAISGDGNLVSIGAPGAGLYRGQVNLYKVN